MNGDLKQQKASLIRSFVFGVEDSLVSTVGLIAGIAAAGVPRLTILLTGFVLIFVEAISMAVGNFVSERSAEEYLKGGEVSKKGPLMSGVVMFFSYLIFGLVPLTPYMVFNAIVGFWVSISLTLLALFLLGALSAKVLHLNVVKHGLSMLVLGGLAVFVGVVVGKVFNTF